MLTYVIEECVRMYIYRSRGLGVQCRVATIPIGAHPDSTVVSSQCFYGQDYGAMETRPRLWSVD